MTVTNPDLPPSSEPSITSSPTLSRFTLLVMAFSAAITVANLYYNQPLLVQMMQSFHVSFAEIGWIPTVTQVGYAIGMFCLVPLGDMLERKRLIITFTSLSAITMAVIAFAPAYGMVVAASLLLGLFTMTPQLLVPFAAHLAPPGEKGKVVGTMVSGILLGILLARTISGFLGGAWGWRFMFGLAAGFLLFLTLLLNAALPTSAPTFHGRYTALLGSVIEIFRTQPVLQEASLFGGMFFGAFSLFWATLIFLMETPQFNLGAEAVGLYGLLGAGAVCLSPLVGKISDRYNARKVTGLMFLLTILSFGIFWIGGHSLWGIAIGVLLMDLGVQSGHISNQSRIFSLLPHAQSRIQTAYMFCYFVGGALGSILGAWSWGHFGWPGVCVASILLLTIGLLRFLMPAPTKNV